MWCFLYRKKNRLSVIRITSNTGELLHLVVRASDFKPGRVNVSEDHQFLQCALLNLDKGHTFRPHMHIWKEIEPRIYPQESWTILKGSVQVTYYDTHGVKIRDVILRQGDMSFSYLGGHTYLILEDNSVIIENKVGPYLGVDKDKIFI